MPRRPDEEIKINGIECTATLWDFDSDELKKLQDVFSAWINLNEKIEVFGTRLSNLNEIISEGAASYFLKFSRVEKKSVNIVKRSKEEEKQRMKDQSKYMEEKFGKERKKDLTPKQLKKVNEKFLPKPSTSFDCYDEDDDETVQIKASVGLTNTEGVRVRGDLTNFGPRSEFDRLFFLDFFAYENVDGRFAVYEIPLDILYNTEYKDGVTLQETLDVQAREMETLGRTAARPHFSLREKVIKPNKLTASKAYNLMTGLEIEPPDEI